MALTFADRVHETSLSTGTGSMTLAGAEPLSNTFVAGIGNGNTTHYSIVSQAHNEWEVGLATLTGGVLARTTVYASSNANALVNFSSGIKDVYGTVASAFFALGGVVQNLGTTPSIQAGLSTLPVGAVGAILITTDTKAILRSNGSSWVAMSPIPQLSGDVTTPAVGSSVTTLANTAVTPGSFTSANLTVDAKGRITAAANGTAPITGLTGDITASGTGSVAATLATVNGNVGTFSALTVNGKGLVTAGANLALTGDVTGTASGAGLVTTLGNTAVTPGTYTLPTLTVDSKGRITGASNGSAITALTGDITASGSGSVAATLATVNGNVGSFTAANITVDAKGRITAASNGSGAGGISSLTGDVTGAGSGPVATTLATVNSNVGSFTSANITVDGKGRITAAASGTAPLTGLTGDVTASGAGSQAATLATVNGSPGTGNWVTVNGKGLATAIVTKNAALNVGLLSPTTGTFILMLSAPRSGTINSVTAQTDVGTCTVNIQIGTTSVTGISAVAVTSTAATTNATAANTFVAGNKIQMVVSSLASSPTQLSLTINFTPT